MNYIDLGTCLQREDGASVPKDPRNKDYQDALANGVITPAPAPTKPQQKAAVTGAANAFGFNIDQIRILRAVLLLITGTPQQKMDATAFLQPLLTLLQNVSAATTAIDANQVPAVIPKPILPAIDP